MRHPRYYLAHHPGISFNITSASRLSTPPTPLTLAHQPSYPRWHTTNGLSPIIMNEVFNFQENKDRILGVIYIYLVGTCILQILVLTLYLV